MLKNKKKFKSSEPYLKDIILYARKIRSHISTVEKKIDFKVDTLAYDAISMIFLQIGESVVKLENSPEQIVSKFSDSVPWHELKGLRNLIAHDYARVDPVGLY